MKFPHLRWCIAALLFTETLLAYLDMQEVAVLAPILREKLGVGHLEYSMISQAFLAAYTITFLLGGLVIDRLGVRKGLALSLALWSAANILHALARTPGELAFYRFLLGLAYPGAFLAAARAVSEWYPAQERAFVYGVYVSGATVGAVVAYPMVTFMALRWAWQAPFVITGVLGLVLAVVWWMIYRRPEEHPWITDGELAHIRSSAGSSPGSPNVSTSSQTATAHGKLAVASWRDCLRARTFWAVAIGRALADSVWIFYVLWLAKYLNESQGLSLEQIGRIGWIPFVFADVGSMGGGWLSGWLVRRGASVRRARITILTAATLVRAFTFVLVASYSTPVLIALVGLFVMSTMAWQVNLCVLVVDDFPARVVATVAGITTSFGTLSTVLFSWAVGRILSYYSYEVIFILLSLLSLAAYAAVLIILTGTRRAALQPAKAEAS